MADKLGGDNVRQMPTRAAKGAGKSKPDKAPARLRPPIPAASTGLRARAGSADQEKKLRDALQLQLIGYRARHTKIDTEMDALRELLKEKSEALKIVRAAIETAGMPLALFDEAYKDGKTSRVDLDRKERLRAIVREAFGEPSGASPEMFDRLPDAVKAPEYWKSEGYRCGIAGLDPDKFPKPPPEHLTDFQAGLNDATASLGAGLKSVKKSDTAARTPIDGPAKDKTKPEGDLLKGPAHPNSAVLAGRDPGEEHDDEEEGIEDDEDRQAGEPGDAPIDPGTQAPDIQTAPAVVH